MDIETKQIIGMGILAIILMAWESYREKKSLKDNKDLIKKTVMATIEELRG